MKVGERGRHVKVGGKGSITAWSVSPCFILCNPKVRKEARSERRVTSSTEKHKADQVGTYWSHG